MLEKKDLEMIAEVVNEIVRPISEDVSDLKNDVNGLKSDVNDLKNDMDGLKGDVGDLKNDVDGLKGDVGNLRSGLQEVQMTLENETNRNIKVIAEGHLDLSRKLDDALKIKNEKEMLLIRVTSLENEVRRLKAKVDGIA